MGCCASKPKNVTAPGQQSTSNADPYPKAEPYPRAQPYPVNQGTATAPAPVVTTPYNPAAYQYPMGPQGQHHGNDDRKLMQGLMLGAAMSGTVNPAVAYFALTASDTTTDFN